MIAIPNMEKPRWCSECPMWSDTRGCHIGADDYDDCPLIEIDDELFKKAESAYVLQQIRYGERRADEHTDKRD